MSRPTLDVTLRATERGTLTCREVVSEKAQVDASATLLWIHGLGESGLCFERILLDAQFDRYRHLAPDLRGYGRSERRSTHRPLSLVEHAEELRGLCQAMDGPLFIIGHSMGGVIGQMLCELFQAQGAPLAGFVNIEGNLSFGDCGYSGKAAPQSLQQFLEHGFDELQAEIYRLGIDDVAHRSYYASCSLCSPAAFHSNALELVSLSRKEQLAPRFAALDVPKAFVQGSPRGAPQRSAQLLLDVEIEPKVFEPAGHWPFIDQCQPFVTWLKDFLDPLRGTRSKAHG